MRWRWPEAAFVYEPPVWMKHVALALMLVSFVFWAVSQLPAGRIKAWVRHPLLLAVKIWASAISSPMATRPRLSCFSSLLAWAVIDRISVKRREAAGEGAEIVAGPVGNDVIAVAVGARSMCCLCGRRMNGCLAFRRCDRPSNVRI